MEMFHGIVLVTVAGLGTGSIAWPMKIMRMISSLHKLLSCIFSITFNTKNKRVQGFCAAKYLKWLI